MSKQNIYFVSMQSTYQSVECALYNENKKIAQISIEKKDASSALVPELDQLLKSHDILVNDLSFLAVNQGPAPFTTLRVVISTANGISFATGIPLIGVDGLEALLDQVYDSTCLPTVVLLDAFTRDVYFAVQDKDAISKGCMPITDLLADLKNRYPTNSIRFIGNGCSIYENEIKEILGDKAFIPEPIIDVCSLEQISSMALERYQNKDNLMSQVVPLYLKKQWWQQSA